MSLPVVARSTARWLVVLASLGLMMSFQSFRTILTRGNLALHLRWLQTVSNLERRRTRMNMTCFVEFFFRLLSFLHRDFYFFFVGDGEGATVFLSGGGGAVIISVNG